jgi:hypothetical protein
MKGFKDFVMRGNLVELAVAFIMAAAFAAVVTTFTNWLLSLIPAGATNFGDTKFGRSLSSTSPGPWRRRPLNVQKPPPAVSQVDPVELNLDWTAAMGSSGMPRALCSAASSPAQAFPGPGSPHGVCPVRVRTHD